MNHNTTIAALQKALQRRKQEGNPAQFWLRDDDVIEPTSALDQLLAVTQQHHVPLALAAIPAYTREALAQHLQMYEQVSIAVHGWSHANYASTGEKKQELGPHRARQAVLAELSQGYQYLSHLHADRFVPLLVPPWNRISVDLLSDLPAIGFKALSVFGAQQDTPIPMINTQVDVIDWKGTRGGRPATELFAEIVKLLDSSQGPVGILTHHLVHDASVWNFLEQLFSATAGEDERLWVSVEELMAIRLSKGQ